MAHVQYSLCPMYVQVQSMPSMTSFRSPVPGTAYTLLPVSSTTYASTTYVHDLKNWLRDATVESRDECHAKLRDGTGDKEHGDSDRLVLSKSHREEEETCGSGVTSCDDLLITVYDSLLELDHGGDDHSRYLTDVGAHTARFVIVVSAIT